jgi:hypothetical protein
MPNLSFKLVYQAFNGQIQELDITDKVVYDSYPLEIRETPYNIDKAEGTLKILDEDGEVEKIMLGIKDSIPSFGAPKIEVYDGDNLIKVFYATGKYSRSERIIEVEYETQKISIANSQPLDNIADLNLMLADRYGVQCLGPAFIYSHSSRLSLAVYVGVEVPQDIKPWEISSAIAGNKLYVLFRNILARFDLTAKPWKAEKVVDIRDYCDSDNIPVSGIITNGAYDVGICGQIVEVSQQTIAIMVNVANAQNQSGNDCYREFRLNLADFSLSSKSGFFVKHTDIQGCVDLAYNFVTKLQDGRYVLIFKGLPHATVVLSNASNFYQATIMNLPSNQITVYKPLGIAINRISRYDLYVLGGPRNFLIQVYAAGIGGSSYYQDIAFTEAQTYAVGYYDEAAQKIHFANYRNGINEAVYFCVTSTSGTGLSVQVQRSITAGVFLGMGYDSAMKLLEAVFTTQSGSLYYTKAYRTSQLGNFNDIETVATFSKAFVFRKEQAWIYVNPSVPTGGVGELGSQGNIYANSFADEIVKVCPVGFIQNSQFKRWSNAESSTETLGKSGYFSGAKEGREIEAFKRHVILSIDGERIEEPAVWWSSSDEVVSLPITSELSRYILAIRRLFIRNKHYTVQSFLDITSAIGKKISFETPEGNQETAVLTGYSLNSDGEYTYDLVVYQADVDMQWENENDVPSWLVIESSCKASWKRESGAFSIYASLFYRSIGQEHPTRMELKVYEADTGALVYTEAHPIWAIGTIYSKIISSTLKASYLFVYQFISPHSSKTIQYEATMNGVAVPKKSTIEEIEVVATEGVVDNINPFFFQEDFGWEFNNFSLMWNFMGMGWVAVANQGTTASIQTAQKISNRFGSPDEANRNSKKVLKIAGYSSGQSVGILARVLLYSEEDVCIGIVEYKLGSFIFRNTTILLPIEVPIIYEGEAVVHYYQLELVFSGDYDNYPLVIRGIAITSGISKHNIIEGFKFAELLDVVGYSGNGGKFVRVKDDETGLTYESIERYDAPPPAAPGESSFWIAGLLNATTLTTRSIIGGSRTYWWPFVVTRKITIQTVAINVTASATATVSIGVYGSTAQGYPNALLQSATVSYSSESGVKTASFNITLNPGLYWLAMRSSAGIAVCAIPVGACMALRTPSLGASITDYFTSDSSLPAQAPSSSYTAESNTPVPAVGFGLL